MLPGQDKGPAWWENNKRISGNRMLYHTAGRREESRRFMLGWLNTDFRIHIMKITCIYRDMVCHSSSFAIDQHQKSHNAPVPYPPMHISVSKWCIVRYGTGALWDLWMVPSRLKYLASRYISRWVVSKFQCRYLVGSWRFYEYSLLNKHSFSNVTSKCNQREVMLENSCTLTTILTLNFVCNEKPRWGAVR